MKPLFILLGLLPLVGCKHESATNTDAAGAASRPSEIVRELIEKLENTVAEAVDVLRKMDRTTLLAKRKIQAYEVTLVQAIIHVVEHFSYHTGQIVYVAKMLKGVDTQFYDL